MSIRNKIRDSGLAVQKLGPQPPTSAAAPVVVSAPAPVAPALALAPAPARPSVPLRAAQTAALTLADVPKAVRPAVLQGLENLEAWLRKESSARISEKISDKTRAAYQRNGQRLDATRVPGQPVDLAAFARRGSTYYTYRAAVRYHAAEQAQLALTDYEHARKNKDPAAREEARQRMFHYAADLVEHARDKTPGLPTPKEVEMGLADPKAPGVPALVKATPETEAQITRETAKLKAANAINRRVPAWREVIWSRLEKVKSPWLDHTAVASLSGARPEELQTATFHRVGNALCITINGAKVSDTKGQPWRKLVIKNDGSSEFQHLFAKAGATPTALTLPPDVQDYPDAFSAALARAGKQVFPASCPRMSGYVYRHAFAADLKADKLPRIQIAAALGHAVTKTQDTYGRATGGRAGARSLSVTCEREVRQTHDSRFSAPTPTTAPPAPPPVLTFSTPSFGDLGL